MNKWKMNRAGLLNFWYYDDEVFSFAGGKLLLRGSNGSGKSVTMQSFLPVLLDGKKTPDRLDPFGSKARRMEDYLLGEKEVVNRDERTGYLYLEFKRTDTEQYITIGIGLQAKRNKQMKFWGFVISDNRRIGTDLELYKLEKHAGEEQKIPRSRIELENLIAEGGQVVQTTSEYRDLVNKHLFGFETAEAYEDLIKLLIQIRSPKLSKDFKPTVIYDILEAALPPLTDEDLRHLSDTIEQMDQTKQQMEQLEREMEAIQKINRVYTAYNQRILADQAYEYIQAGKRLNQEQTDFKELQEKSRQIDEEIGQLRQEIQKLSREQETYEKQKKRLESHKIWNLEKEREEEAKVLGQWKTEAEKKEQQLTNRRQKARQLEEEKEKIEETLLTRGEEMEQFLLDMGNDAEEASFHQHVINQEDFERHRQNIFNFSVWEKETESHLSSLEETEKMFQIFDELKQKYEEKDKELGEESRELDQVRQQEQDWKNLFEQDKERKLNEIHHWIDGTEWLTPAESTIQEMSRALYSLYEPSSYESVREPFRKLYFDFEQQQRKQLSEWNFARKQLKEKQEETKAVLQEWKQKKDPEPETASATKAARARFRDAGVPFVPFYAAVEFQDHVNADVRKRLEAALLDSGMLDALVGAEDLPVEHDRVWKVEPNMLAHTLADYLQPDLDAAHAVSESKVDEVLRSVLVEEEQGAVFTISEEGHYQLGLLHGHAVPVEDVRYIGRTARKRFREEQISLLEQELTGLAAEEASLTREIEAVETGISEAKARFDQFPDDKDLQEIFRSLEKTKLEVEQHLKRSQQLSEELKKIHVSYLETKQKIDGQARQYNLEKKRTSYQEAIYTMKRYQKDLFRLEKEYLNYRNEKKQKTDLEARLTELTEEIDEYQGDLNVLRDRIERKRQNLAQIELQLEKQGVADIRKEIGEVQQQLTRIGESLLQKRTIEPGKEKDKEYLLLALKEKEEVVAFCSNMAGSWQEALETELSRSFILMGEGEQDIRTAARELDKTYGHLRKEKEPGRLAKHLTEEFYKQQGDLMEYRMNSFDASVAIPAWMNEAAGEEQKLHIEQWKQKTRRTIIELDYQGKQVSPYTVQEEMEKEYIHQESLLNEQDQALYEEILFKSVGNKLRARIRRAEQWADKMAALMESRDSSSGLSFSIKWKPRTADSEAELDTVDLVRLLKQDANLLKEEDLESITSHFRSKINKAKEMMGEGAEMQTLLQVLKEVLDYRKWFSFVLSYRREREPKRELTNNAFYKFSGGEKAMAMYIPLFTACYSRYQEADPSAPYIISLDEAFAGVDENNIREMFEIVEQLGFDYIMNSQVLWGDYDTISSLSICELVRPKNADYVSVLRYQWDGNKIELDLPGTTEEAAAAKEE